MTILKGGLRKWLSITVGGLLFACGSPTSAPPLPPKAATPSAERLEATESFPGAVDSPAAQPSVSQPDEAGSAEGPTGTAESEAQKAVSEQLLAASIDPAAVKAFLTELQAGAIARNREAIVNLVSYPFTTFEAGEPLKTYQTPAELLADFDQVITEPVIAAMATAQYADLFVNYQGVMIGDGEVRFDRFGNELKISFING